MEEILSNKLTNNDLTVVKASPFTLLSTSCILGTPQSLSFYSKWQEDPTNIFQCSSITEEVYDGVFASQCIAEAIPTLNPSTGCQYPLVDHFSNTTFFEWDDLYREDLIRYSLLSGAVECFTQTFPTLTSGLRGDQFAVACTAFCLQELGHTFHIVVHTNEPFLIKFCEKRKWSCEVVGLCPH